MIEIIVVGKIVGSHIPRNILSVAKCTTPPFNISDSRCSNFGKPLHCFCKGEEAIFSTTGAPPISLPAPTPLAAKLHDMYRENSLFVLKLVWLCRQREWLKQCKQCKNFRNVQGDFFNWASPQFAKCWPVSNWFQKNVRVPDWPPPNDRKQSKCLVILILRRFRGGPVEGFLGGASLETFSGEAQLKKSPCMLSIKNFN